MCARGITTRQMVRNSSSACTCETLADQSAAVIERWMETKATPPHICLKTRFRGSFAFLRNFYVTSATVTQALVHSL